MIRASLDDRRLRERLDRARRGLGPAMTAKAVALGAQLLAGVRGALPAGPLADGYAVAVEPIGDAVLVRLSNSQPYAAFYERGFQGDEQVAEHLRKMTVAFGHPVATPHEVLVRAYVRQVEAPAHPLAVPVLEAMTPTIADGFREAVLKELAP